MNLKLNLDADGRWYADAHRKWTEANTSAIRDAVERIIADQFDPSAEAAPSAEAEPEWCDCDNPLGLDSREQTCLACGKRIYWLNEHVPPMAPARTPDGGSPAYRALLDEAWLLHIAKNTGYAGYSDDPWANFRQCEAFGIDALDGVLTRMSDKWSRLQSLWRNPERDQVGEPIHDTLKDLAAYALILVCLMEERKA